MLRNGLYIPHRAVHRQGQHCTSGNTGANSGTGGAWGFSEGIRRVPANAPPKLKLNGILNAVTRRGPFLGNSAGVIAMVYNGMEAPRQAFEQV